MKPQADRKSPSERKNPNARLESREREFRLTVKEYVDDLRELVDKLQRKLLN